MLTSSTHLADPWLKFAGRFLTSPGDGQDHLIKKAGFVLTVDVAAQAPADGLRRDRLMLSRPFLQRPKPLVAPPARLWPIRRAGSAPPSCIRPRPARCCDQGLSDPSPRAQPAAVQCTAGSRAGRCCATTNAPFLQFWRQPGLGTRSIPAWCRTAPVPARSVAARSEACASDLGKLTALVQ